ncbi:hypothetical protein TRAPUB_6814 [Trametes pubescens]|uniref:NAD(P)-binding domain-containing protein n=1 Tax=Trametes pubescens TaxID=154538 RepID=A0A1M2V4Z7_TRAPU|nr:hypothetical protein TRAPUB_6814 [Trametes pubescens]
MSSEDRVNVFLLGATGQSSDTPHQWVSWLPELMASAHVGYIGGSVLGNLLSNVNPSLDLTVLVRDAAKAHKLNQLGVKIVLGELDDVENIQTLASQADIVLECADADHLDSTKAVLAGLKQRYKDTDKVPTLIHTSGTGVLTDHAAGMYATDIIYDDNDAEQLAKLSPEQPHRNVDLAVIAADEEGYVKTYIVLPSTIYGLATGPLVDAGIVNPQSQQIPALILAGKGRGQAGMVGQGKNIWPNVHIDDIVQLYEVLWNNVIEGKAIGHGKEGYYFGENGEHILLDVAKTIGAELKELGLAESDEPTTFTKEEVDRWFGGSESLGSNSRCRANRSRVVGWKPKKGTEDMLASIKPEIQYMLSKES